MQLKRPRRIRDALTAATCTLLSSPSEAAEPTWEVDASGLLYKELSRVSVYEEMLYLKKDLGEKGLVSFRRTHDIMTGASPTGAVAASSSQSFTGPSGGTYAVDSDSTPLGTFRDIRTALRAAWEKPISRLTTATVSANYSYEYDYRSLGAAGEISRDVNQRQTTLGAGLSASYDTIKPVGGIPTGLDAANSPDRYAADNKGVVELMGGVSHIYDKRTRAQLTFTASHFSGYLNDPYKIISQVNATTGQPLTGSELFEKRPGSRAAKSLTARVIRERKGDVYDVSYRFFWDDWGIRAHSLNGHVRRELDKKSYWQPHVRLHTQTDARFYTYSLDALAVTPQYASADYRLGQLMSVTAGALYGQQLFKNIDATVRAEYMRQWDRAGRFLANNAFIFQASLYIRY